MDHMCIVSLIDDICSVQYLRSNINFDSDSGTRALANGVATTGGSNALTVALCTSACKSANYLYAGVEYAGECCMLPVLVVGRSGI